jgi:hypothetical protein
MVENRLNFAGLSERHFGVTESIASVYEEAARVCLGRHYMSPQQIALRDESTELDCAVAWVDVGARTANAWANTDDATRDGAYGIALAAVELSRGLVAVRRAETRTGSDYYLGDPNDPAEDLETIARLEVSGTDAGNETVMQTRLRQKIAQARAGNSNLPAIATVVGFLALTILTSDV